MLADEDTWRLTQLEQLDELVGTAVADVVQPVFERLLDARTAKVFFDCERAMHQVVSDLADKIVALGLQAIATEPSFEREARAVAHADARAAGVKMKSCGRKETPVRLFGGTKVYVKALNMLRETPKERRKRKSVGKRGAVGSGVYPTLAALGITSRSTPALRVRIARAMASANSVDAARADLLEAGLDVPHKRFLRLAYELASHVRAERDDWLRGPAPPCGEYAGKRVVVSVDGGRLRVRQSPTHGRRNSKGHRKYKAPWREPRVLTIYVVDDNGERDRKHDVLIDATMGTADDAIALLIGHLRMRGGQHCEHLLLVADGAHWIWNRADQIRDGVGVSTTAFTELVDFWHAIEKLTSVADTQPQWSRKHRRTFLTRNRRHLHRGERQAVYTDLTKLMTDADPETVEKIDKVLRYYDNNATRMDYAQCRASGLPQGSGAVESAVRRVVNQRLKGNSIYWTEDHAEDVLHLRSFLKAGRWGEVIDAHLRRPVWRPIPIGQAA
ncbi:MAG: hypothetical protein GY772_19485 [bacterium]|nr:hypothetical protein [bacterium]